MREFRVQVHHEEDQLWAEVEDLPGCYAAGATPQELRRATNEAVAMYLREHRTQAGGEDVLTFVMRREETPLPGVTGASFGYTRTASGDLALSAQWPAVLEG